MNWHNKHNVIYLKQKIHFYFQINLNIMIYQNIAYIVLEFISISMAKKKSKKKKTETLFNAYCSTGCIYKFVIGF